LAGLVAEVEVIEAYLVAGASLLLLSALHEGNKKRGSFGPFCIHFGIPL